MSGYLDRKAVLVTGGTGFIGRHLVRALLKQGSTVSVLSRLASDAESRGYGVIMGDLTRPATIDGLCRGMDIVFHLGGLAHAVDQADDRSNAMNWQVTVEGTKAVIEQSLKLGVKRFIFFSSVKAMGEGNETSLNETTECRPVTSYGRAKREAEKIVLDAGQRGLTTTILRLPMVYGPQSKGNLPRMIRTTARGLFPPLPETENKRSMVDVRDVVQAALLAVANPMAAGKVYIVTDSQVYSTRQIYEWICGALQMPIPRWKIPLTLLRLIALFGDGVGKLSGRRFAFDTDALEKLTGSAWYSSDKIRQELNYRPVYTLKDALPEMVAECKKGT